MLLLMTAADVGNVPDEVKQYRQSVLKDVLAAVRPKSERPRGNPPHEILSWHTKPMLAAKTFFDTPWEQLTPRMEEDFFTSPMTGNKTYKTTFHHRFSDINPYLLDYLLHHAPAASSSTCCR